MNDVVINKALEYARLELLDMGIRGNSLLHLRQSAKTLEVVDEKSHQVYDTLVESLKPMTFACLPGSLINEESGKMDISEPLPRVLEAMYGESRHTDTKLQTKLAEDSLDKRLLKISTEASTYYEEQGIDILYLALGFLTWYEDKNSDLARKAPLVLIPVALERTSARERFKLRYTEAELGENLTLAAKLKMEFQITLPGFGEELDFDAYIDEVHTLISDKDRWKVNKDDITLGFFSFGKFQMYQDLATENWPTDKAPGCHPILQALLGDGFESLSNAVADNPATIKEIDLADLNFVKDADSSQTDAVLAVKQGKNLVIQGPPGTGKSQTITNIISEMLSDGKRILFVAEKMAALDVVKRRLDETHLGDAVLELHSHKSNKKSVMEELKRTLELGRPQVRDHSAEKTRYRYLKEQLDSYSEAVYATVLGSGVPFIDALGHYLALKKATVDEGLPAIDFKPMKGWTGQHFIAACGLVNDLSDHLEAMGVPEKNAFSDTKLEDFSPIEQERLERLFVQAQNLLAKCLTESKSFAEKIGVPLPATISDILILHRAAKRAVDAPHLEGLNLTTDDWQRRRDHIKKLLEAGKAASSIRQARSDQLIDQAWHGDVLTTREVWVTTGRKWWRLLSGDFRQAKRHLSGTLKGSLPVDTEACISLLDDILEYQTNKAVFADNEVLGESLFGAQWQGIDSDWPVLEKLSSWVVDLYDEVGNGRLPQSLLQFLEGDINLQGWSELLNQLAKDTLKLKEVLENIVQQLDTDFPAQDTKVILCDLSVVNQSLSLWGNDFNQLYYMTRYNRLMKSLDVDGVREIAKLSFSWPNQPGALLTTLKIAWYGGLVEEAYKTSKALSQFDRVSHENMIAEFKTLDKQLFHFAQEALLHSLYQQTPNTSGAGEMAIIRKEINRKRRLLPIRKLISQAGRAVQQIKPVFMMSPMSVATYLQQGAVEFDLVVFDEASQVKVVRAIGPILRGKQVVVVGDTRQMPPTDFFSKALELEDEEADESQTADIESILNMFLSQSAPESMLRWHYRSKHDSLIAVSNQEFYEGKLMIFPSPGVNPIATGLKLRHLPETVYERGGSRTNPEEAKAIALAVMVHAKNKSSLTLGVVAFSTAQRDCIILELERLRREDPSCESFFNTLRDDGEGFFVKNLENVQGDERDVIFISIGYGRTASGRVGASFGPVNRDGGQRRFNVLITRARLAMEVFSNFVADDLKLSADSPFGVRALKNFLKYAESGELEEVHETGKDTDSPFEDEVISAIKQLGYDVEPQVGTAGFFIDIAVRDPSKLGRYILAVECDGASYHSSASARDRDRLRQDVLEGLGWRFHRIWSTDWFRAPAKQTERLNDAIKASIAFYNELDRDSLEAVVENPAPATINLKIQRATADVPTKISKPYVIVSESLGIPYQTEIHTLSHKVLLNMVQKVINTEGPVHKKEAARRIANSAGFSRVGARMMTHIESALKQGTQGGFLHYENDFIFKDAKKYVWLRDRSNLDNSFKNIELVPYEELELAILESVKLAFSISKEDVISEALSLMGFNRVTANAKKFVMNVLDALIKNGKLDVSEQLIRLAGVN